MIQNAREYLLNVKLPPQPANFKPANTGKSSRTRRSPETPIGFYFDGNFNRPFYEVTNEVLAASLGIFIDAATEECNDENPLTTNASRLKGLPRLPDTALWPSEHYFLAQLWMPEIAEADHGHLLPATGMLHFFLRPSAGEGVVLHTTEELSQMFICQYPNKPLPDERYYLRKFRNQASSLAFTRKFTFYIDGISKSLPAEIKENLQRILKCEMADKIPATNIFARPFYYQGEIDAYSGTTKVQNSRNDPDRILLFQTEFAEGHVHFWITPGDLAVRNFKNAYVTFSGT